MTSPSPEQSDYKHWHRPVTGPGYWDYRCRVCNGNVEDHAPWIFRMWERIKERWS